MQDFKQLVALAQDSPNLYKRTRLMIANLINTANSTSAGPLDSEETSAVVLAPSRQGERVRNDDVANRSSLSRAACPPKKQRAAGVCTVCRSHNEVPVDQHRAGSSRCPFTVTPSSQPRPPITTTLEPVNNVTIAQIVREQRANNMQRGGMIRFHACESQGLPITESHFSECPLRPNPHNPTAEELQVAEATMLEM